MQNGVAEQLNWTLLELTCAMVIAQNVLIFLWEYAIAHAMYLRNCVYHKSLNKTPYKITHNEKPNISHLHEFGSLVWILLQGQDKPPKLQPHSKAWLFVGYNNGSKSVLYYNAETRKVLISCNFRFLNLPEHDAPPEQSVTPTVLCEREMGGMEDIQNDQNDLVKINSNNKRAREQDEPNWEEPPRKLRAKAHVDYCFLDNPFPDKEQNEEYNMNETLIAYNVETEMLLGGRDPLTLCEA